MKNKNYWLFGASILLLIISIALNISSFVLTNEAIVLVFVGILATFIVVGNYAQVAEIKKEFQDKIKEINDGNKTERNKLNAELQDKTKELQDLKNSVLYNIGETYRTLSYTSINENLCKSSVGYAIKGVNAYEQSRDFNEQKYKESYSEGLSQMILSILKDKTNWEKESDFDNKRIEEVKQFPDYIREKYQIITLLQKYEEKKSKNTEEIPQADPS
ncbi:MAG: hypothetical protein H6Q17_526 [Bacteroidetes bacterium]|nr:hypothetical protein [Bacteroidota bacterium]